MLDHHVFTTERLVVRPWHRAEAPRLLEIRALPEVARWLSDPTPWTTAETAVTAIEEWSHLTPPLGVWAIVPTELGHPVGSIYLRHLPDGVEVDTGWYLHPAASGRGYAAEAARGAIAHGFTHGIERIWAAMWPENEASARVARAAGMRELGVLPDPWYGTEEEPDSLLFRAEEAGWWRASRSATHLAERAAVMLPATQPAPKVTTSTSVPTTQPGL